MEDYSLSIIVGSTGLAIYVCALYFIKKPPKKINSTYGYRTQASRKSQAHWDFAQAYSSKVMKNCGLAMIILGCSLYFLKPQILFQEFIGIFLAVLFCFIPLIVTERALKERFPE